MYKIAFYATKNDIFPHLDFFVLSRESNILAHIFNYCNQKLRLYY